MFLLVTYKILKMAYFCKYFLIYKLDVFYSKWCYVADYRHKYDIVFISG